MNTIVRGNDFNLRIPIRACDEGGVVTAIDLTQCDDIRLTLQSSFGSVAPAASVSRDDKSVLVARIDSRDLQNGLYNVEVTGIKSGVRWRSERGRRLRIVETDYEACFCAHDKYGNRVDLDNVTIGDIVITAIQPGAAAAQVQPITEEFINNLFKS